MDDIPEWFSVLMVIVLIVGAGLTGAMIEKGYANSEAVKHHAAFYDPYTAEFTWNKK